MYGRKLFSLNICVVNVFYLHNLLCTSFYQIKFTAYSYSVEHLSKASQEEVILTYVVDVLLTYRCSMHYLRNNN